MQKTKPKSAKETKTQNQAMITEDERNPYMKKKKGWEKRENLGEVDNEVPEIGVQASLLLKQIGNGFANGFESKGSQRTHHGIPLKLNRYANSNNRNINNKEVIQNWREWNTERFQ